MIREAQVEIKDLPTYSDKSTMVSTSVQNGSAITVSPISKLRRLFVFDQERAIAEFFECNRSLVDWLIQSREVLLKHFGADVKFVLKIVKGVYSDSDPHLVVYIQTHTPVVEATDKLDAFDNEWFFDQIDLIGNKVIFNLAPV